MKHVFSVVKDRAKIKIVLLEGIHSRAVEYFARCGYTNVHHFPKALEGDALREVLSDAHFVGIRSRTQLTPEVLSQAKAMMGVGCFCIGTNQVALNEAALLGIPVFNAPHSNTRSVAELVIGLTIMLMRGIFTKSQAAHKGGWQKTAKGANEIRGKKIGIVGYGHIGSQVSILAENMGMQVYYYDVLEKLPLGNARPMNSLELLLKEVDLVTLHVPQLPSTVNLMSRRALQDMRNGAYLINASRGTVVDLEALSEMIRSGRLGGAAVDVFPKEPKSADESLISPLQGLDNVILTPHIGGSTQEAQENIAVEVARKLVNYCDKGITAGAVNFPEVTLPEHENWHRLLHIHNNIPGILSKINSIVAQSNINILGQHLVTNQDIGYVVLEVAEDVSANLQEELQRIDGTIRCRLIK